VEIARALGGIGSESDGGVPVPVRPLGSFRRFWTLRVSVPAPALLAAAAAILALFFWLRPAPVTPASPEASGVVTHLNATGFQPLPNGEARIVPAMEVQK
jgi:hypothetical protein